MDILIMIHWIHWKKNQTNIPSVLFNFRLNKHAVSANISKMCMSLHLETHDASYQHSFIPTYPTGELKEIQYNRVSFGAASLFEHKTVLTYCFHLSLSILHTTCVSDKRESNFS